MSALANRPIELAMTHYSSDRACPRPKSVRAIVKRMRGWKKQPEGCQACRSSRSEAIAFRGGLALCGSCAAERRDADIVPIAGRLAGESRGLEAGNGLVGHAIVFNSLSVDLGGFREIIKPEAVMRVLAEGTDLRALWNHDSAFPLGRISAGTLQIRKDARGLVAEIDPNAQGWQFSAIQRGDVTGMSFAFQALDDDWRMDGDNVVREVRDMAMSEVSPVTFPAYPATDISAVGIGKRVDWLEKVHKTRMAR
jgi:HK97 family phage prohead protease